MLKVISGGQTGVDQAALRAAKALGIETGGWAPRGYQTEAGPGYWLRAEFGMDEHTGGYPERNRANVWAADGTLILYERALTGGTALTGELCREKGGSCWIAVPLHATRPAEPWVWRWLLRFDTVNVAGPRESKCPGIGKRAEAFLLEAFRLAKEGA